MPDSAVFAQDGRGHLAVRVPNQDHARAASCPPPTLRPIRPSGVSTGRFSLQIVEAAAVNLHGAPPVRRVAGDDAGEFELPRGLFASSRRVAGGGCFRGRFRRLAWLKAQLLILAAQRSRWRGSVRSWAAGRRPALAATCWAAPVAPNSGRKMLPMASLRRAVVLPGRFKTSKVSSATRARAI